MGQMAGGNPFATNMMAAASSGLSYQNPNHMQDSYKTENNFGNNQAANGGGMGPSMHSWAKDGIEFGFNIKGSSKKTEV